MNETEKRASSEDICPYPVIVLAGGWGSRLSETTRDVIPKPMVQVRGVPFLDLMLLNLHRNGARQVTVSVGHLGHVIEEHLANTPVASLFESISIVFDSGAPKGCLAGTGQAVRSISQDFLTPFVVANGDTYCDISLPSLVDSYETSRVPVLGAYRNDGNLWPSNVAVSSDGMVTYRKSGCPGATHVVVGLYVLDNDNLEQCLQKDFSDILEQLSYKRRLRMHVVPKRFYEINTPQSLRDAERFFSSAIV